MLARVATYEFGDRAEGRRVLAAVRDGARELVEGIAGWRGVVHLAEREGGRATVIHFLDDEHSLAAAEALFAALPRRLEGGAASALRELNAARESVTVVDVLAGELDRLVSPPGAGAG
ncbi:MAG: hypothetical protein ICV64_09905 [Thermoleophilia bacterium]|nr:hypothetical protein [Thermoleophilia bacterium]